jgi:hypothetical protein
MTPAEEARFLAGWQQGAETAAIAELSTHLRKHVLTD